MMTSAERRTRTYTAHTTTATQKYRWLLRLSVLMLLALPLAFRASEQWIPPDRFTPANCSSGTRLPRTLVCIVISGVAVAIIMTGAVMVALPKNPFRQNRRPLGVSNGAGVAYRRGIAFGKAINWALGEACKKGLLALITLLLAFARRSSFDQSVIVGWH